jgi:N6-L-threonylcarbamoyladenine synthase
MKILSLETSCDDTSVAVIEACPHTTTSFGVGARFNILSNIVSSQVKIHKKYGGVYPMIAKREHQKNLVPVLEKALKKVRLLKNLPLRKIPHSGTNSKILNSILEREPELLKKTAAFLKRYKKPEIDTIAVTVGPGLEPCLWVGVNFAKALAYFWDLPVVPVNHVESHILANFIGDNQKSKIKNQNFPAVCLIVSGGHTQIILMAGFGKYKVLGETRDDAAGECFDKTARILGLDYPGGPAIASLAKDYKLKTINYKLNLPRPMINTKDYDFSFSGLKTAVLYDFKNRHQKEKKNKGYIKAMCAEIQQAVIDVLIKKTLKAARDFKVKSIILGGGVSANEELRKQFKSIANCRLPIIQFLVPPKNLCTDNAAMVGAAGYTGYIGKNKRKKWSKIKVEANLRIC